jgi:hypothetical protein
LGFEIEVNENLFFSPKESLGEYRYTTKHKPMQKLNIDIYYGDSDTDIMAAIKADVHAVRIVRSDSSIVEYGSNYFGNTLNPERPKAPFDRDDLEKFYQANIGVFGESIYPITWDPSDHD